MFFYIKLQNASIFFKDNQIRRSWVQNVRKNHRNKSTRIFNFYSKNSLKNPKNGQKSQNFRFFKQKSTFFELKQKNGAVLLFLGLLCDFDTKFSEFGYFLKKLRHFEVRITKTFKTRFKKSLDQITEKIYT